MRTGSTWTGSTRTRPTGSTGWPRTSTAPATATRRPRTPADILALVAWGMDRELREVFELVRAKLEEIAEDQEADDE